MTRPRLLAGSLALLAAALPGSLLAQTVTTRPATDSREPPPWGQRILAKDGDVVLIDDEARVRIVRRRQALVRAIANPTEQWVIVLVDFAPRDGGPDGRVDRLYSWRLIEGRWPLEERWEGSAFVEEYHAPGQSPSGIGIVFPAGRVQFLPDGPSSLFADSKALAVLHHRSSTTSVGGSASFDEAEQRALKEIAQNAQSGVVTTHTPMATASLRLDAITGSSSSPVTYSTMTPGPAVGGPVRVGGGIHTPRKVRDVPAVYPDAARQAGVSGIVVLELTVGADGAVTEARVLRGQPLLDQAALDAARQWRYEPVVVNGTAVPVILTATVNFAR